MVVFNSKPDVAVYATEMLDIGFNRICPGPLNYPTLQRTCSKTKTWSKIIIEQFFYRTVVQLHFNCPQYCLGFNLINLLCDRFLPDPFLVIKSLRLAMFGLIFSQTRNDVGDSNLTKINFPWNPMKSFRRISSEYWKTALYLYIDAVDG